MLSFRVFLLIGLLMVCAVVQADDSSETSTTEEKKTVDRLEKRINNSDSKESLNQLTENITQYFDNELNKEEGKGNVPSRRRRSVDYGYGYANYGRPNGQTYGGNYGGYLYGYGNAGGYASSGHGNAGGYSGGRGYGNAAGGYGHGNSAYGNGGYINYDRSHTKYPVLTFIKGFRPGKSYVEKGKVVRNYYRHGTYEVALQHYRFIPVIKVEPYTTYDTVGYTGHIRAENNYNAVICKDCYYGYPKIDVISTKAPYSYMTRRFVYLPENYRIDGYKGGNNGGYGDGGNDGGYGHSYGAHYDTHYDQH